MTYVSCIYQEASDVLVNLAVSPNPFAHLHILASVPHRLKASRLQTTALLDSLAPRHLMPD